MRLLTFSFLKNCKLKPIYYSVVRKCSKAIQTEATRTITPARKFLGDPSLVEIAPSWSLEEEPEMRSGLLQDMQVLPDFVSEGEEAALLAELEPYLKRMRYEFDHWDNAIQGYRETERSNWQPVNQAVFDRVKAVAFAPGTGSGEPLPHVHVLDLAGAGFIKPHVDAVRFCGEVIAGICLCSSAVMRLQYAHEHEHAKEPRPHLTADALLARRSLYIMRGVARYSFSHAVLGGAESVWRGEGVPRQRRVALICRSKPHPPNRPSEQAAPPTSPI